jgi:hypothetical protein
VGVVWVRVRWWDGEGGLAREEKEVQRSPDPRIGTRAG